MGFSIFNCYYQSSYSYAPPDDAWHYDFLAFFLLAQVLKYYSCSVSARLVSGSFHPEDSFEIGPVREGSVQETKFLVCVVHHQCSLRIPISLDRTF